MSGLAPSEATDDIEKLVDTLLSELSISQQRKVMRKYFTLKQAGELFVGKEQSEITAALGGLDHKTRGRIMNATMFTGIGDY